ncbi:hypothetical protein M3175_07885 [Robertmurraya korlensis]|uniref:hypothetical protein n=1 Tax=Robertmurraya korlensis TaxID=519977 RepID=UPI002040875D|nr:hypothetical protein [Robertmurraya korlensis]MCM3600647.1 hypothetical protein [Robertmurraya korlensis]
MHIPKKQHLFGGDTKVEDKEWLRRSINIVLNHQTNKDEQLENIMRLVEAYENMKQI